MEEKSLECSICFSEFIEDSAYIPVLDCSCILIVHEECWNKWTGICIYCRTPQQIIERVPVNVPVLCERRVVNIVCAIICFLYARLVYLALYPTHPSS